MRRLATFFSVLLIYPMQTVSAADVGPSAVTNAPKTLETIVVQGVMPGPGMWRVSKGDHVLWILGTLSPLPAGMKWQSKKVEATIAHSQEVLGEGRPSAKIGVGTMFKMASLMPSALRTQHNPGGAPLKAVVDPALYARWVSARDQYAKSAKDLENLRPVYASQQLYWSAVETEGMTTANVVQHVIAESAKRSGVPITDTGFSYPLELDRKQLKERIAAVNQGSGTDIACFTATLDKLDADLTAMKVRANAWAIGDVGALRGLVRADFQPPCKAVDEAAMAFLRADELKKKLRATWLAAAERGLANNESTFAFLPIWDLLDQDGVLSDLRHKGFLIEAPDDEAVDAL